MKIWKLSKSNISIDLSKYVQSIKDRIDFHISFGAEEHQRLLEYKFNPDLIISSLEAIRYPNINLVKQFFQTKDFDELHKVLMDIFSWYKQQKDIRLWDKLSPVVKALNDYESILSGNEITWTEEYGQKRMQELISQTQVNMEKIQNSILGAISRIPQWNGSSIKVVASELYKDNDLEPETDAIIEVGGGEGWGGVPNFSYFASGDKIELDDILEGGDSDFFTDNNIQSDYFNLVNSLRNPQAFSKSKVLSLYTARPAKDRQMYMGGKEVPSNIFLTSSYDFAEGFAYEYGGGKDVWKVRILDRYLVKTMDSPDQKQYQTMGDKVVPVVSIELITPWVGE